MGGLSAESQAEFSGASVPQFAVSALFWKFRTMQFENNACTQEDRADRTGDRISL